MAVVRCPRCQAELDVADRLLGQPVACGACGGVFDPAGGPLPPVARPVAPADDEEPPRRRRRRFEDEDFDDESDDRPLRPDARPAYLPGLLSAILCLLLLLVLVGEIALAVALPQAVQNNPLVKAMGGKPPPIEFVIGVRVVGVVYVLTVLAASFRMMSGRNRGFAVVGMVMHLLFLCGGLCWPLGAAVGVWGLVVLHRPEVVAGFALNDRPRGWDDREDELR